VVLTDNSWGLYHVARVPCAQFPSEGAEAALAVADRMHANYLITRSDAHDRIPAISEIVINPRFQPHLRYPTGDISLLVYRIVPAWATPPEPDPGSERGESD
jgi:hypothetical protein